MKLPRRHFLRLAAGAALLPIMPRFAWAQAYPTRPVRIVLGYPAGGGADIVARLIAIWLSERVGQPFVIENRPGAGTNLATEVVVRAPADGYTLLFTTSANAFNATLYNNLTFNFIRDTAPVAGIVRVANVMVVHPSFPAKTVPEFIARAKANPGKINMASAGIGTPNHLSGELFKAMAGVDMAHVPYRGDAAAIADLLGSQIHVTFAVLSSAIEHVRTSKLRALAVTTGARQEELPDVPAVGEFLKGYEASAWNGVSAPKSTPQWIVDKLNEEINAALANPKIKARLADLAGNTLPGSPADFGGLIADETEKWAKVIRAANIKPE